MIKPRKSITVRVGAKVTMDAKVGVVHKITEYTGAFVLDVRMEDSTVQSVTIDKKS